MTQVTRFVLFVGLYAWVSSYASPAFAYARSTITDQLSSVLAPKSKSAEICASVDGKIQVLRGFIAGETYFVEAPKKPTDQPEVKKGYVFKRESGGFVQRSSVSFDMFELMVEPFGGAPVVRAQWLKTFEEIFEGKIAVTDDKGVKVGIFDVACNAAIVEF